MSNPDLIKRPPYWKRKRKEDDIRTPSRSPLLPIVGVVSGVLLLVFGVVGWRMGTAHPLAPTTAPTTSGQAAIAATATSSPATPTADLCSAVAEGYLKVIIDQEQHNKWDVAADNAESALNDAKLCADDRQNLAQKYVTDSLEGLYARSTGSDKVSQEEALERYRTIENRAKDYDVAFTNPLNIAQHASQSNKFLVAKFAYEEALQQGTFTISDTALLKDYVSVLCDIGDWWTRDNTNSNYGEGLRYLSASWHVSTKYNTTQPEAWGKLKELLGPDETTWPEPVDTPLLNEKGGHSASTAIRAVHEG